VRRNDEVAAQRRRWTFYETINYNCGHLAADPLPRFKVIDLLGPFSLAGRIALITGASGAIGLSISNVSQLWKYTPKEFLKLPGYSRDYPL